MPCPVPFSSDLLPLRPDIIVQKCLTNRFRYLILTIMRNIFTATWIYLLTIGILLISCSGGLEPVSGISGKVTFNGVWPDSLAGAVVAVFSTISQAVDGLPDGYSDVILNGTSESFYFVQLDDRWYGLTAVAGVKLDSSIVLLQLSSSVVVKPGKETSGMNFVVNF